MSHPVLRALPLFGLGLLTAGGCRNSDASERPAPAAVSARAPSEAGSALLAVGQPVPDISGVVQDGAHVSLRGFAGKPLVVYFYPKDETTGCTIEAEGIRDAWKDLQASGAVIVGVSADDDASHRAFTDNHKLPFLLLSDVDHSIAKAFGVPVKNGKDQRVTFVVGKDGKIAKVFPAVDPHAHAAELVLAVRQS
jgi:peroxiredoxin Q/BCP